MTNVSSVDGAAAVHAAMTVKPSVTLPGEPPPIGSGEGGKSELPATKSANEAVGKTVDIRA